MKKILIVSDHFFPSTAIGAVRPSKIAKKLKEAGYHVDVFTRYPADKNADKYCDNLYSFEQRVVQNTQPSSIQSKSGLKKIAFRYVHFLYMALYKIKLTLEAHKRDNGMLNAFKAFVEKSFEKYDVIFTTFGPLGSLICGLYYKKKNPSVKWICDFRDPAVVSQLGPIRNFFMHIKEQQACKAADEIVAVSNGYVERICGENYREKCHMIPNGYDTDDLAHEKNQAEVSACLELVYAGILYGDMRDITPIFSVLNELINEGEVDKNKIKFNYAGTDYKNMISQAERFNLGDIVFNHGVLPREKCLELQFSSDLLVLSTWNTKKEYGVFPGKLLEYMLIGKPIVTTVSGDLANSEVSQVIREGNLGVVYEAVNHEEHIRLLKEYLKNQYDRKISGEGVLFVPEDEVVQRYNYNNIINQIEELIEKPESA